MHNSHCWEGAIEAMRGSLYGIPEKPLSPSDSNSEYLIVKSLNFAECHRGLILSGTHPPMSTMLIMHSVGVRHW